MRQMSYMVKVSLLKGAIQKFLGRKNIGMYKNEADLRLHLAADLKEKKFEVEEEREVTMVDKSMLKPDIIVYIQDKCIPIELKYRNTSIEEYEEDEQKCTQYINDFSDVYDAYCIFVSNIEHRDYRHTEWIQCEGNSEYHYLWIPFEKVNNLYI